MAYARVVSFDGVDKSRMDELAQGIREGERPEGIPATEILLLHNTDDGKALAIVFFETEDDYRQGDATLNAMDAGDTPGRRTSVERYEVAVRRSD